MTNTYECCACGVTGVGDWLRLPAGPRDAGDTEPEYVCETCEYDACASVGQMRDNIRHMRTYPRMIADWLANT